MNRPFTKSLLYICAFTAVTWSQPKKADLSKLVVVGDSLSAGFQNFSLLGSQQVHSYAKLIANQAGTELVLPLVNRPGLPNVLQITSFDPLVIEPVDEPAINDLSLARPKPYTTATNLAVPGVTIAEVLNKRPSPTVNSAIDAMTNVILGFPTDLPPQSQVERAVMLKPTTILFWAGSNDLLLPELTGDFRLLTPWTSFGLSLHQAMDTLAKTGASIVIANLPDPTLAPYFLSAETIAEQANLPVRDVRKALGLNPGDLVRPVAQPLIFAILNKSMPGPLPNICRAPGGKEVIPGLPITEVPCVFRSSEVQIIKFYTLAYNRMIQMEAAMRGATLVDIEELTNDLAKKGRVVNGQRLTLDFLGGLISLDGLHPTDTLHAIIANEFIKTMNRELKTGIPPVSVVQVAKEDLLFPKRLKD